MAPKGCTTSIATVRDVIASITPSTSIPQHGVAADGLHTLHKACTGSSAGHTSAVSLLLEGTADVHALNSKWREADNVACDRKQATGQKRAVDVDNKSAAVVAVDGPAAGTPS